jgi:hypothetical protein
LCRRDSRSCRLRLKQRIMWSSLRIGMAFALYGLGFGVMHGLALALYNHVMESTLYGFAKLPYWR